jgi:hypothetical protein
MLWSPAGQFTASEKNGSNPANGTTLTAGSANVKGSWTQLIASTQADAYLVSVALRGPSVSARYLLDLGVGPSGQEQVVVPNLAWAVGTVEATPLYPLAQLPILIPAGSRLVARVQSNSGSAGVGVYVQLFQAPASPVWAASSCTTYGANTATTDGLSVTPGANTWGSWTEVAASTGIIRALTLTMLPSGIQRVIAWQFGVGASGSETPVSGPLLVTETGTYVATYLSAYVPLSTPVPSGSRLSVRGWSTGPATRSICVHALA